MRNDKKKSIKIYIVFTEIEMYNKTLSLVKIDIIFKKNVLHVIKSYS